MNKNEIINTIAEITNLIKTKKKTLKQLTDIHETLTQIAPALDNRELKEEIDLVKFNIDLLIDTIHQLNEGKEVQVPWYDFLTGNTGGYRTMQGDRDASIIAEGIHMLNPLIFDKIRDAANGVYVAPRTRIITNDDKIVKPEQLRVARRMIRDYYNRGHSLRATVMRAESVDRGEVNYIMPYKQNAAIHIDTFHDYEPCLLAKYLYALPAFREEMDEAFLEEHGLTDLMKVMRGVPPLETPYVPRDSLIREFVGGSIFEY